MTVAYFVDNNVNIPIKFYETQKKILSLWMCKPTILCQLHMSDLKILPVTLRNKVNLRLTYIIKIEILSQLLFFCLVFYGTNSYLVNMSKWQFTLDISL